MTLILHTVRRETATITRDGGKPRPLVVELHAGYMTLKPKGCRRKYSLTYYSAYMLAVKQAAEEIRLAARQRLKDKKAARAKSRRSPQC